MKRFLTVLAVGALALCLHSSVSAQVSQSVHAGSIILTTSGGGTVTIAGPTGFAGNLTWQAPIPPGGNPLAGFVNVGTANGQLLQWDNTGAGQWSPITLAGGNIVSGTGVATQVAFWNTANTITSSSNLFWNNASSRLGIGIAAPTVALDVVGAGKFSTGLTVSSLTTGIGHLSGAGVLSSGPVDLSAEVTGTLPGTSVNPNFGGQAITTTGNISTTQGNFITGDATHNGAIQIYKNNGFKATLTSSAITADRTISLPDGSGNFALTALSPSAYTDFVALSPTTIQNMANNNDAINIDINGHVGNGIHLKNGARDLFIVDNNGNIQDYGTLSLTVPLGGHSISFDGFQGGVNPGLVINDNATGADVGLGSLGLGIGTGGPPDQGAIIAGQTLDLNLQGAITGAASLLMTGTTTGVNPGVSVGTGYQNGIRVTMNKTAAGHYGIKGDASGNSAANKVYGVWGIASNSNAANVNSVGVRAEGSNRTTDGQTNTALEIRSGELNIGRQATDAASAGGTNIITEDDGTAANGPSGVVTLAAIAAPAADAVTTGTLTVHNLYANATSIVLSTILNADADDPDFVTETVSSSIANRGAGVFDIRVSRQASGTGSASTWAPKVGFLVINAAK